MPELKKSRIIILSAWTLFLRLKGKRNAPLKAVAYSGGRVMVTGIGHEMVLFSILKELRFQPHTFTRRALQPAGGVVKEVGINQNITVTGDFLSNEKALR
jgi:hypothetical protein